MSIDDQDNPFRFFDGPRPPFRLRTVGIVTLAPFVVLYAGWKIAGMGDQPKSNAWWSNAGCIIELFTIAATIGAIVYVGPIFREARPGFQLLLGVVGLIYFFSLLLFNFHTYSTSGSPFL
jgi:hypothetical protein